MIRTFRNRLGDLLLILARHAHGVTVS